MQGESSDVFSLSALDARNTDDRQKSPRCLVHHVPSNSYSGEPPSSYGSHLPRDMYLPLPTHLSAFPELPGAVGDRVEDTGEGRRGWGCQDEKHSLPSSARTSFTVRNKYSTDGSGGGGGGGGGSEGWKRSASQHQGHERSLICEAPPVLRRRSDEQPLAGDALDLAAADDGLPGDNISQLGQRSSRKRSAAACIPLWVQVCLLMLVPIGFVAVYLGLTLHTAAGDLHYLERNAGTIEGIFACEDAMMRERDGTSNYIVESRPVYLATAREYMAAAREETDETCDALRLEALGSQYDIVRGEFLQTLREAMSAVRVTRFAVDAGHMTAQQVRDALRHQITSVTNGIVVIGRRSVVPVRLTALKHLRNAANRLGMCRAIGFEVLEAGSVADDDAALQVEAECAEPLRRYLRDFRETAGPLGEAQYARWAADAAAQETLHNIAYFLNATLQAPLTIPPEEFFSNATAALNLMLSMSSVLLSDVVGARRQRSALTAEALKLGLTLLVSITGVLLVSRAQRLASARVEFALERTHKMSLAVQAFIPRSFLKLMAVESILNLERGDQTQVAVTMLFCDIRNFTGISEHMTNEQLFEWLQAHLKRMTRATEKHRGFVNTYVGDAVSAIFLTPLDACRCAVNMQSVTDALCYELVAHNEDHMVRIGVGVHHALVGVGILGNDKHHTCAIVSAEANVANQLEALTKEYGARIIMTAQVHDQLPKDAFESRPLGRVRLSKSAVREYVLHEIFQADMPEAKAYKSATLAEWEQMLALRECERFDEADAILDAMEKNRPANAPMLGAVDQAVRLKRGNVSTPIDVFDLM